MLCIKGCTIALGTTVNTYTNLNCVTKLKFYIVNTIFSTYV